MSPDPAAAWLALCTASAAGRIGSMLELEGYLTGVIAAPSLIAPSRWIAGLWDEDDPVFDDDRRLAAALGPIAARHEALGAEIEASLERLQADNVCDWRPVFLSADGKPDRAAAQRWAVGFWKAATLDPDGWSAYVDDERIRMVIAPLMTFAPFVHGQSFDPADDDVERLLDDDAAAIPRSVLLVRMIAKMRAERPSRRTNAPSRLKIGRNDPCPCGTAAARVAWPPGSAYGFLTLAGFAAFPWVGVLAAVASSIWALWANARRAADIQVPRWAVKLAGTVHVSLCAVLQASL